METLGKLNGNEIKKIPKMNSRFCLNLLYVALNRFRDYTTIIYPVNYKETITPILES